jgi:ATP-dependent DNA ligase
LAAKIRARPLSERRSVLHWYGFPARGVQAIEHVPTHGEALFREIAAQDCEVVVAKRLDAPCSAGRQPTWLKVKNKEYSRRGAVEWRGP